MAELAPHKVVRRGVIGHVVKIVDIDELRLIVDVAVDQPG